MKKLLFLNILICTFNFLSMGQPPMGTPSANQPPDVIISVSTYEENRAVLVQSRQATGA